MKYEKQKFVNGQVLSAECLNHMEEGIKGACDAAPPTCTATDCSKVLSYGENGLEWIDPPSVGAAENAVLYTEQNLTTAQKARARENIGALGHEITKPFHIVSGNSDGRDSVILTSKIIADNDDMVVNALNLQGDRDGHSDLDTVVLRGLHEGIEDTDAVNKKQLDDSSDQLRKHIAGNCVYFTQQELGEEEKESARQNIGAVDSPYVTRKLEQAELAMIDKLCPSFTESGAVVTCEPVEGYPLEVAWQKKNLFNEAAWYESHGFTQQEDGSWLCRNISETCFTNTTKKPGSMYLTATMKTDVETTPFYLIAYYTDGTMSTTLAINKGENTFVTKTLTTDSAKTVDYIKWTYGGGGSYYLKGVMISFVDHVYEPYAETATITRFGKNLVDTDVLLNTYLTKDENGIYHFDGTVASGSGVIGFNPPIPANTPIHFKFHDFGGYNANSDALLTTSVSFADGTSEGGNWFGVSQNFTNELTFKKKKAVTALQFYKYQPSEDFWCQFSAIQVEIGTTATEYEPYREGEAIQVGQQIVALPGVNTFLADSGVITVSGKANPAAEIEKLKNAILSLGGNV